jgi:hypothetical protein
MKEIIMYMVIDTKNNSRYLLLDANDLTTAKALAVEIRGRRSEDRYVLKQYDHHQLVRNELLKHGETSKDFPRKRPVPKGMNSCQRCSGSGSFPRPGMDCYNCGGKGYMSSGQSKACGEAANLYWARTIKADMKADPKADDVTADMDMVDPFEHVRYKNKKKLQTRAEKLLKS